MVPEGAAGGPAGGGGPALGRPRGAGLRRRALDLPRIRPGGGPRRQGADGARRRERRARRALDEQPARMALSRLRHRQDRRRAGAAQHPLPHGRRGLHGAPVRQRNLDQHRPLRPRRLRGDAGGGAAGARGAGPARGEYRGLSAAPSPGGRGRERRARHGGLGGDARRWRGGKRCCARRAGRSSRSRRAGDDRLHLGHHRASQGRAAHPRDDPQHARAGQPYRPHLRGRVHQSVAALPYVRFQRGRADRGDRGLQARAAGPLRCRRVHAAGRGREGHDHPRLRYALQGISRFAGAHSRGTFPACASAPSPPA